MERGWLSQMRRPLRIPSQSIHLVPLPAPLFFGYSTETRVTSCIRCGGDGVLVGCPALHSGRAVTSGCEQMIPQLLFESCGSEAVP